jgi:hypothetical protein
LTPPNDTCDKSKSLTDKAAELTAIAASVQAAVVELRGSISKTASALRDAARTSDPEVQKSVEKTLKTLDDSAKLVRPIGPWNRFWQLVNSGLFFMLVGCAFLITAGRTMGSIHAAFTFVLVVVGVAILLYGTGTQGMGEFSSEASSARYRIGIAGGAGILALAVGFGIVEKAERIKNVFQIEKKYVRVILTPQTDGISTFRNYVPEITTSDGESVAALRHGEIVEVFVPYFETEARTRITFTVVMYNVESDPQNRALSARVKKEVTIDPSASFDVSDGRLDFPKYKPDLPESMRINMQAFATSQTQLSGVDEHQKTGAERRPPNDPPPPAILVQ